MCVYVLSSRCLVCRRVPFMCVPCRHPSGALIQCYRSDSDKPHGDYLASYLILLSPTGRGPGTPPPASWTRIEGGNGKMCEHVRGQRYGYGKLCYRILYSFWSLSPITTQLRYRIRSAQLMPSGCEGRRRAGRMGAIPSSSRVGSSAPAASVTRAVSYEGGTTLEEVVAGHGSASCERWPCVCAWRRNTRVACEMRDASQVRAKCARDANLGMRILGWPRGG